MRFAGTTLLALCAAPLFASITIKPSADSFNPTLHHAVRYEIVVDQPGTLTAQVLDRDTYVAKTLVRGQPVAAGPVVLTWDGTDDDGRIVPDEAWSLRVLLKSGSGMETYFPASSSVSMTSIKPDFYDSHTGVLRYTLPLASRVHLQAGIADRSVKDPRAGAVMKTIVNRAPRPAGAIVEQWMGMDESNTIYVPALPNFVVSIAATPLPENSVITFGNKSRDFVHAVLGRGGEPLVHHVGGQMHHAGLSTLDDVAPQLTVQPENAVWRADRKGWVPAAKRVKVRLTVVGPTASHFKRQPGRITVYVDKRKVVDRIATDQPLPIDLPDGNREHIVAVNWSSDYGPVAATAFRTFPIAQ